MNELSSSQRFYGATKYYAEPIRTKRPVTVEKKTEPRTERMASLIPYWPKTITYKKLSEMTGISRQSIVVRVSSCHERFRIFSDDDGSLSRLKDDLSNCDLYCRAN